MLDTVYAFGEWFARQLLNAVPISVAVGLIGWMFKEKWKQVLTRSLTAETEEIRQRAQLAIETAKAEAQKSIETYKASLVREVEKQKALVDLNKVLAVRHATAEYEALMRLHATLAAAISPAVTYVNFRPDPPQSAEQRIADYKRVTALLDGAVEALGAADIFITPESYLACLGVVKTVRVDVWERGLNMGDPYTDEEVGEIQDQHLAALRSIADRLKEITTLG